MGLKPRAVAPPEGGYPTLEYRDDRSSKFWAVSVLGSRVISSYGRIGTDGQTSVKDFPDPVKAQTYAQKTYDSKLKKGYAAVPDEDGGLANDSIESPPVEPATPAGGTTYEAFVSQPYPTGLASSEWSSFPLWFDDHETIIAEADSFSVIDDFMSDLGMDDFEEDFSEHFPNYRGLAACAVDVASERQPGFVFDSYAEFFLCVDVSKAGRPVLLWTGEGQFETLFPSFAAFHASLSQWKA